MKNIIPKNMIEIGHKVIEYTDLFGKPRTKKVPIVYEIGTDKHYLVVNENLGTMIDYDKFKK